MYVFTRMLPLFFLLKNTAGDQPKPKYRGMNVLARQYVTFCSYSISDHHFRLTTTVLATYGLIIIY